ncbi:MAG TPA: hypothetical protein VKS82_01675 [Streptosporangiaceae bacterium]|nr:hypothetical protein [Streptosporangiaceae bacterium]
MNCAPLTAEQLRSFAERGYLMVPDLVSQADLDRASAEADRLIAGNHRPRVTPGITFTGAARPSPPSCSGSWNVRTGSFRPPGN